MKTLTVILIFALPYTITAQIKFDYNWIFGYPSGFGPPSDKYNGTHVDFNFSSPKLTFFDIPVHLDANAAISDSSGNLLFYTNGCSIINRKHEVMVNGDGINEGGLVYEQNCEYPTFGGHGYPAHQGTLILPWPEQPDVYMLLHLHRPGGAGSGKYNHNLLYTTVDMTLDNGLGAVAEKNALIFQDTFPGDFLTAVRHGNGRDWWVLLPKFNSPHYYSFLLSPQGVSGPWMQEGIAQPVAVAAFGSQAAFSPNGKKYATASYTAGLQVFDFDRCTGKLSNPVNLRDGFKGSVGNGVAFSSNSRYLYVSANLKLYQFDLKEDNFLPEQSLVGVYDSFGLEPYGELPTTFYQLMLAPDGKIYMTTGNGTKYLHVIHQPNESGLACDFEQRGLELLTYHAFSPPNFPHFRLFDMQGSPCDTLGINGPPPPEDTTPPPPLCAGSIKIYPNPTQSMATIELPECQGGSISVFDVAGRWVEDLALQPESVGTVLDVSTYLPGIYFLRIRTSAGEVVTRALAVVR